MNPITCKLKTGFLDTDHSSAGRCRRAGPQWTRRRYTWSRELSPVAPRAREVAHVVQEGFSQLVHSGHDDDGGAPHGRAAPRRPGRVGLPQHEGLVVARAPDAHAVALRTEDAVFTLK